MTGTIIFIYSATTLTLPGQISLTSPSGSTEDATPTFIWNEDASTTWYKLLIWDSSEKKIYDQWHDATKICSAGNCSVSLETVLSNDSYEWWVESWNDYGSVWSDGMTFIIQGNDIPPSKVTHTSPSGQLATSTSIFTWVADPASTWYRLWVGYPGDIKIYDQWHDATKICSAGNCSVSLETVLSNDSYEWWVESWNDYGSVWSDGMTFIIQGNDIPPSKVTHTSPSGQLATSTSIFTWVADPASTWYRLWVGYPGDIKIYDQWHDAANICSDGNCTVTTGTEFNVGNYEWYVKSWNDYGTVWSNGMSFSVAE